MNTSLSLLLQTLNPIGGNQRLGSFAVDVGAHHGEYANFVLGSRFFDKVISFEPNLPSYLTLLEKVKMPAGCKHQAVNVALSSRSGTLELFTDDDSATASLLKYSQGYQTQGLVKSYSVSALTLDDYLNEKPESGRLTLLKTDTQGNDLSVILGARETILQHRPIIQTELIYVPMYQGQCSPREIEEALLNLNYRIYSLNNLHVTPEGCLAFCDAIFIPSELDVRVTQKYSCIDDQISFENQIKNLEQICSERLAVINVLDSEVRRLKARSIAGGPVSSLVAKVKSWVR